MERDFTKAYEQLNTAQKQAVDTIDGPVLVVAGPGTGKTQLLSVRVANILKRTDTDAGNILCLTFTNKAATNMRERLYQLIGPASRNVVVRTFHSFAADIMNQYPDYFWEGARLSVAPDAVQLEIILGILAELPLDNPLASTFAGSFTALGDVQQALKLAKEAGLTPDELRSIIQENLAYIDKLEPLLCDILAASLSIKKLPQLQTAIDTLPEQTISTSNLLLPLSTVLHDSLERAIAEDETLGKTTHTGKWKQRWVQTIEGTKGMFAERKRNSWWLSVADVYEAYREQLHVRGYYDYSDMLIEVLEQLQANPDMLADIQERFLYVLIDEFQDTNAAQLRLSHLVADHYAANGQPNLMAVGDDDQSIFAFNGAELNNMLGFQRSYPTTKLIVLSENYRSTQAILDTARDIIEQAEDRLTKREATITKELHAQPTDFAGEITQLTYPTREHQYAAVAERIKASWQAGETSIAVLARSHDSLKQLAAILLGAGVPVRYEQQRNILQQPAIKQLSLLANIAVAITGGDQRSANLGISELLQHPMWQLSDQTLWKLAIDNYSHPDWLGSLLNNDDEQLQAIGHWLAWLARVSQQQPLAMTFEQLLGLAESPNFTSPFRAYYLDQQPTSSEYLETLSAVQLLLALTREFGDDQATLADFVRFITLNLSTKRVIADESWFASGERAVELLTIHKAKGLEFNIVFLVDTIESIWRPRTGGRSAPANLHLQAYGEQYDDYIRLLYVAASRAKHSLIATNFSQDGKGTSLLPTPLLSALPATTISEPDERPINVLEQALRWPELKTGDERALLADRLDNFAMSPTALINFLNVVEAGPSSFKERDLLHLPRATSPSGSYGTAIHAALQTAQRLINTTKLDVGTVLDRFEASLRDEHLAPSQYEQFRTRGTSLLHTLLDDNSLNLTKGGLAEQRIADIQLTNAMIKGDLDRIDVDGSQLMISDYKTGKPLSSFDTKDQTKAIKAWRHRTQLLFYALLVQKSARFKARDIHAQMIYVESETVKQRWLRLEPRAEELERLEHLIEAVWQRVMALDFPDVSGFPQTIEGIHAFEQALLDSTI